VSEGRVSLAIEMNDRLMPEFISPERGMQWQPFLK
jgi:hypothetical protein